MAFSKITLTFTGFDSGNPIGEEIFFKLDGDDKNETGVAVRSAPLQWTVSGDNNEAALNYKNSIQADYPGIGTFQVAGNQVIITANYDGAIFSDFSNNFGRVSEVIENVAYIAPFELLTSALSQATNPCTDIRVTLTQQNGTAPFTWLNPLVGTVGLVGDLPRLGSTIPITIADDNGETDSINVFVPAPINVGLISRITITGDQLGATATVAVSMVAVTGITYEYSLDGTNFQTSNVFTAILPGNYTLYVADQYGCVISKNFSVTISALRPPAYRSVPLSNSFSFIEQQQAPNGLNVFYNGYNVQPNDYVPSVRWYNKKYFQHWTNVDTVTTQFRSNYDQISARLVDIVTETPYKTMSIVKKSNNLGLRQILQCVVYDRGNNQSGVYFLSGNTYDADGNIVGSYDLDGKLPTWARVGNVFTLSGTASNGTFQIKQTIFDEDLLVDAIIIDRVYTDAIASVNGLADATYNKLDYEVYEFDTSFADVVEGCYRVELVMQDSLGEYQNSFWDSTPLLVDNNIKDECYFESSDHPDDGIDYSTGIIHKQRVRGVAFVPEYDATKTTNRDSARRLRTLDGRTTKIINFSGSELPFWVDEKLSLFISKKLVKLNGVEVNSEEGFERSEVNLNTRRMSLSIKFEIVNWEQYFTDTFDPNLERGFLLTESGFLKL